MGDVIGDEVVAWKQCPGGQVWLRVPSVDVDDPRGDVECWSGTPALDASRFALNTASARMARCPVGR